MDSAFYFMTSFMIRSPRRIFKFRKIINVVMLSLKMAMLNQKSKHKNIIEKFLLLKFFGGDDTKIMVFSSKIRSPEECKSIAFSRVT